MYHLILFILAYANTTLHLDKDAIMKAAYGIVIQNNQISNVGTGGNGISVFQSSYACITDNTIQNTKNHGICMNSSKHYGVVIHNTLRNLGVSGILIDRYGKYVTVLGPIKKDVTSITIPSSVKKGI